MEMPVTEIKVSEQYSDEKLKKYLFKYFKKAPQSFIYKMLRKKNIVLNGKKASGDEVLHEGDIIKLFMSDETISKFTSDVDDSKLDATDVMDISNRIIFVDDNFIIIDKPSGILSQKASSDDISLNEMIRKYAIDRNLVTNESLKVYKPSVANRLDRNTSGIILAGVTLRGSRVLTKLIKSRLIDKYYMTIVSGEMESDIKDISYISKNSTTNTSVVISKAEYDSVHNKDDYNMVETEFYPVRSENGYTLVRVKLITGKSHQIRAVSEHLGFPVAGDRRYNGGGRKMSHMMLHSYETAFPAAEGIRSILDEDEYELYEVLSKKTFTATLPEYFFIVQ